MSKIVSLEINVLWYVFYFEKLVLLALQFPPLLFLLSFIATP